MNRGEIKQTIKIIYTGFMSLFNFFASEEDRVINLIEKKIDQVKKSDDPQEISAQIRILEELKQEIKI